MRTRTLLIIFLLFAFLGAADAPDIALVYSQAHFETLQQKKTDPLVLYRAAIQENGGNTVVLSPTLPEPEIQKRLESLEGVLLPGGGDIHPSFYGETSRGKVERLDEPLDRLIVRILRHAHHAMLPVLGVCRGHQFLNVFYGGTLYQDLPSELTGPETRVRHRGDNACHAIHLEKPSLLYDLLGLDRLLVNSIHHQAVKTLGNGFRVSARSEDGVCEALEREGGVFLLGVQFHPERMRGADPRMNALFVRLIAEAGKRIPHPGP